MQNAPKWKTAGKYVLGMLILAVTISFALFFPEWYAKWQDEKLYGEITLSHREQIHFLDTTSLDIAGKMKVITEAGELIPQYLIWQYDLVNDGADFYDPEEMQIIGQYFGMKPEEMIQKARNLAQSWCNARLLPPDYINTVFQTGQGYLAAQTVYAGDSLLTFLIMTLLNEKGDGVMLVTDSDVELIYSACAFGNGIMEFMAQEMGFASLNSIPGEAIAGNIKGVRTTLPEEFDLAVLCGAETAVVEGEADELEFEAVLQYTNFESKAKRSVVVGDLGFGLMTWFGSEQMEQFLQQYFEEYGSVLMLTDTRNFLEVCSVETEPAEENFSADSSYDEVKVNPKEKMY